MTRRDAVLEELQPIHTDFFRRMRIDSRSGEFLDRHHEQKFACFPYVGSRWGEWPNKLLVVGLGVGKDETPGRIQSFEHRRRMIEERSLAAHNAHIAGTYFTAMRFGGSDIADPQWPEWDNFKSQNQTCQQLLKRRKSLPSVNPLSFVALTNFYKWTTKAKTQTLGKKDLRHVAVESERAFFVEEVRAFAPTIVTFQGTDFAKQPLRRVVRRIRALPDVMACHVLGHPSRRHPRGVRWPRNTVVPLG